MRTDVRRESKRERRPGKEDSTGFIVLQPEQDIEMMYYEAFRKIRRH